MSANETVVVANEMPFVWVLSSQGYVAHGPRRRSVIQATSVAKTLARRLGWTTKVSATRPEAVSNAFLPPSLAGLSPVWKDATLAARWNRA